MTDASRRIFENNEESNRREHEKEWKLETAAIW